MSTYNIYYNNNALLQITFVYVNDLILISIREFLKAHDCI